MNRWKQVIGDELRAHADERRATAHASPHFILMMEMVGGPATV